MSTFDEIGRNLSEARKRKEDERTRLHRAREKLRQVENEQKVLDRFFDPDQPGHERQRARLEARKDRLDDDVRARQTDFAEALQVEGKLLASFQPFTDPRSAKTIGEKDATLPFLMFPVRLETRFKKVPRDGSEIDQLWVRVYPDDCLIDTFEPSLSESEIESARKFWVAWIKAGGVEEQQRGAWRSLVAGFSSGRAAWVIEQYRPTTEPLPTKASADDILLVVLSEPPLPDVEKPAIATYWQSAWIADGDATALTTAGETLATALGATRAAQIIAGYRPYNFADTPKPPKTRRDVAVEVTFLDLPDREDFASQRLSWSQPPRVHLLPERFVLLGYHGDEKVLEELGAPIPSPLVAGPDPQAEADEQMRLEDGEVVVGEDMKWMVDFDAAVDAGMGFRVDLSPVDARRGFDRLLAVGVRLSADETAGKELVEELFLHHQQGTAGFSLLPQGTPTNNTEGAGSGFSESEDADDSYDALFTDDEPLTPTSELLTRSDGQWLADMLGLELKTFKLTTHARGRDQCEARAMNTALWPATWGYFLETMLGPLVDATAIAQTRWFFTHFVSARGLVPAIRIGDQPYGILPTTVWSRKRWLEGDGLPRPLGVPHPEGAREFLRRLDGVLETLHGDWQTMSEDVAFIGKNADRHQILLDVVGLNPASVEFHQRYAESLDQLANRLKLSGLGGALVLGMIALAYTESGTQLLGRLGSDVEKIPEILEKFFLDDPNKLKGDLIDDQELSETAPIRAYTADGKNYLEWLVDAAQSSFDTLRQQKGFLDDKPPTALLYLLLRYALEQGYWDAGLRLVEEAGVLAEAEAATARIDPSFVHVADRQLVSANVGETVGQTVAVSETATGLRVTDKPIRLERRSESRYEYLYRAEPAITGDQSLMLADFLPAQIGKLLATRYLNEQLRALEHLDKTPTARLERLLAEHLDLCTYRLDSWRWGLLNYQLSSLRYRERNEAGQPRARQGIYVGAFGWLENVRSERKRLTPVELDDELTEIFQPAGSPPLLRDNTNAGFVHAPSLQHAVTAAILRNGYLSHAAPGNPDTLAVNLSSARVRAALAIIEGVRTGQKLGALLGYQLERGLHDRHALAEVDHYIFKLRRAFPLVTGHRRDTQTDPGTPIEAEEARNVVDGLALVEYVRKSGVRRYPFGRSDLPPTATQAEADAIDAEVDRLLDVHDAVADLAVAEGVYQAVQANYGRAGATLDAYGKGAFPPQPEVVQTPRSGLHLTHRVGLHLEAGLDPNVSPNSVAVTPRTRAEPALNRWLNGLLPAPDTVVCQAHWNDPADGSAHQLEITQAQLGLQPLDLLYVVDTEVEQAMAELDDRIVQHVITGASPRPDARILIRYTERPAGKFSFFEVGAMLRSLRRMLLRSRPLHAADIALSNEASRELEEQIDVDATRINQPLAELEALLQRPGSGNDLGDLIADMDVLLDDTEANRAQILNDLDGWSDRFVPFALGAARFGLSQATIGFLHEGRRQLYSALLERLGEVIDRWQQQLDDFDTRIAALPGLSSDDEKLASLRLAERLISSELSDPQPPSPAAYETALTSKRALFAGKKSALETLRQTPPATLGGLHAGIVAELPLDAFDLVGLDLDEDEKAIVKLAEDLQRQAGALAAEIKKRKDATRAGLTTAAGAVGAERVKALVQAAQALFGEAFKLVPEFIPNAEQASEWEKAWNDRGELLTYLETAPPDGLGQDFPVDDWLYGVARVREKLAAWENVTVLAAAFGNSEPELTPIQLPYRAADRWLALEHPDDYDFDGDRLLYTACYAVPFDKTAKQCGLLLDEWTEVIPAREETTGLTFHYDRPNSEPPQTLLLVTSPSTRGGWQWQDLVDALHETLEEARLRAVEPAQVDDTAYARFLPAAIMATTRHPITIALNLALNNQVQDLIDAEEDHD